MLILIGALLVGLGLVALVGYVLFVAPRSSVLVALLLIATSAHAQEARWLARPEITAVVLASMADVASTEGAIIHNAHVSEANPLMGDSQAQRFAVKIGGTVAMVSLLNYLGTHGHPRVARVLGWVDAGGLLMVTGQNLANAHKH